MKILTSYALDAAEQPMCWPLRTPLWARGKLGKRAQMFAHWAKSFKFDKDGPSILCTIRPFGWIGEFTFFNGNYIFSPIFDKK